MDSFKETLYKLFEGVGCRSRSIASLIVDKDGNVIGTGTNNPTCNCVSNAQSKGYLFKDDGKTCVRYLLGAKSGQMLNLCNARHAEQVAIQDAHNRGYDTTNATMYVTCECPCSLCANAITNAGIKSIYIKDKPDYDPLGREILSQGKISIHTWDI